MKIREENGTYLQLILEISKVRRNRTKKKKKKGRNTQEARMRIVNLK